MPPFGNKYRDDIEPFLDEGKLRDVLRRQKPTKFFWEDMSDLFGHWVPDEWIDKCFATMALTGQHTHQVLTKRAGRMREYVSSLHCRAGYERLESAARSLGWTLKFHDLPLLPWPIPNVWLGVSVENQKYAEQRIPLLLETPASLRFISCEPLLGLLDLSQWMHGIGWTIGGGESGDGARECKFEWIRSIVKQCREAGVPVFVKQLGKRPTGDWGPNPPTHQLTDMRRGIQQTTTELSQYKNGVWKLRDKKGGAISEFPEDLRVREFPNLEAVR